MGKKKGWYHFLQPGLEADPSWRKQKKVTIYLPAGNDLADTARLRQSIDAAKRMMRLLHPESIQDAAAAHKRRVRTIDPRFDVRVSLVNETPMFDLWALEPVSGQIEFKGSKKKVKQKVSDLLDRGAWVEFGPGEVRVTGTKLFEEFERLGGAMRYGFDVPGTVTLTCRDAEGRELARLGDVPGRFTGGRKEAWFRGRLEHSPLSLEAGPMAEGVGGSAHWTFSLKKWDGQRLLQLPYFDRLLPFFKAMPGSASGHVEGFLHGNRVFSVSVTWRQVPYAALLAKYMTLLDRARKVAAHLKVNPAWSLTAFDRDSRENAELLYAILFEGGWRQETPKVKITAHCVRRTFNFDVSEQAKGPVPVRIVSDWTYTLLGERIEVGKLAQDFSEMKLAVKQEPAEWKGKKATKRELKTIRRPRAKGSATVEVVMKGSENTVMTLRKVEAANESGTAHAKK